MDAFSYLSVLLSIILGLAITQLLQAAGRLIRGRDLVRFWWPPMLWAAVLLVIAVQMWWSMFGLRTHTTWSFLTFLVVLLQTVTLYMMTALVLPEAVEAGVDLRAHYERHAPWLFGFLIATLLVSVVKELVLDGRLPERANLGFHLFALALAASAIVVRDARWHRLLAVVMALAIAGYIALLFSGLR